MLIEEFGREDLFTFHIDNRGKLMWLSSSNVIPVNGWKLGVETHFRRFQPTGLGSLPHFGFGGIFDFWS